MDRDAIAKLAFAIIVVILLIVIAAGSFDNFNPLKPQNWNPYALWKYGRGEGKIPLGSGRKGTSANKPYMAADGPAPEPMDEARKCNMPEQPQGNWSELLYREGLESSVIDSHKEFIEKKEGSNNPDFVLKLATIIRDGTGKRFLSRRKSDIAAADAKDLRAKYYHKDTFSAEEIASGEFKNDPQAAARGLIAAEQQGAFRTTSTASTNSVRDHDESPVPRVGLFGVNYDVPISAGARQVPSEDISQLPHRPRLRWN